MFERKACSLTKTCESSSGVEHHLAKVRVAGSNPVFRSSDTPFRSGSDGGIGRHVGLKIQWTAMSVRVQVPLRVRMKKDQVERPGFLFLGKSVELALKGLDKNKKHGTRSGPVFFLSSFGRDSAKLIPAFADGTRRQAIPAPSTE